MVLLGRRYLEQWSFGLCLTDDADLGIGAYLGAERTYESAYPKTYRSGKRNLVGGGLGECNHFAGVLFRFLGFHSLEGQVIGIH